MATFIIGGGIAGLTVAEALAKQKQPVVVLEKYPAWGGRIVTHRDPQYEIGAGRIHRSHHRVAALVKRFGLHTFPISADSVYNGAPNPFLQLFEPIRKELIKLPAAILGKHTIAELVPKTFHPIFRAYPYWAEIHMLRADLALPQFAAGALMGTTAASDYYGVAEGLDSITSQLAAAAEAAGAVLNNRHRVHDVHRRADGLFEITGDYGKKAEAKPFRYIAPRVILATCRCSLSDFSALRGAPLLKQLATSPLVRVYAIYPPSPRTGRVWFADLPKTVSDSALRYIIPINVKTGLIMISYTDGEDTSVWSSGTDADFRKRLQDTVKKTFPEYEIPTPTYLERHVWPSGCTYWLPGEYKVSAAIRAAMNPSENLYVVGESISTQQAWIEGALESAEKLIRLLL